VALTTVQNPSLTFGQGHVLHVLLSLSLFCHFPKLSLMPSCLISLYIQSSNTVLACINNNKRKIINYVNTIINYLGFGLHPFIFHYFICNTISSSGIPPISVLHA